jgi:hypothetical protein
MTALLYIPVTCHQNDNHPMGHILFRVLRLLLDAEYAYLVLVTPSVISMIWLILRIKKLRLLLQSSSLLLSRKSLFSNSLLSSRCYFRHSALEKEQSLRHSVLHSPLEAWIAVDNCWDRCRTWSEAIQRSLCLSCWQLPTDDVRMCPWGYLRWHQNYRSGVFSACQPLCTSRISSQFFDASSIL